MFVSVHAGWPEMFGDTRACQLWEMSGPKSLFKTEKAFHSNSVPRHEGNEYAAHEL